MEIKMNFNKHNNNNNNILNKLIFILSYKK